MDRIVYDALSRYYNALEKKGYMPFSQAIKLLVLVFYWEFLYHRYRCIPKEDYRLIDQALNCLFGTTCLIPYPDYLKMGKLHIGDMAELACRVQALEDAKVVKVIHNPEDIISTVDSDVMIVTEEET